MASGRSVREPIRRARERAWLEGGRGQNEDGYQGDACRHEQEGRHREESHERRSSSGTGDASHRSGSGDETEQSSAFGDGEHVCEQIPKEGHENAAREPAHDIDSENRGRIEGTEEKQGERDGNVDEAADERLARANPSAQPRHHRRMRKYAERDGNVDDAQPARRKSA